jgi:metallo-beta-lactamase class B
MAARPFVAAVALGLCFAAGAGAFEIPSAWLAPVEPFRIFGPVYYVGGEELAAFLITTSEGHLLVDAGIAENAPQIVASIEKLGFRPEDVEYLLLGHAHFDHAGALAELKRRTGARLVASRADAELLTDGGQSDFAFGETGRFPPVVVDATIDDGAEIPLGGITLTAHLTPGHTRGCTTWTAPVAEGETSVQLAIVGSLSVPDPESYRLAGNPDYPEIADDYAATFRELERLPCELFLAEHASFFDLAGKRERLAADPRAFVDPEGCKRFVARQEAAFRRHLEAARTEAPPARSDGEFH